MANVELAVTVLRGHMLALAQMDTDLHDLIEEFELSEEYLTDETDALRDVRGVVRLAFRELAGQQQQLGAVARARNLVEPGDILTDPTVIDQPVSPAPRNSLPQENP